MKKQKPKAWWPGMYEGLTPQDINSQIGKSVNTKAEGFRSNGMSCWRLQTFALRKDGNLMKPFRG